MNYKTAIQKNLLNTNNIILKKFKFQYFVKYNIKAPRQ